jgi:O-antigen ligase
LRSAPSTGRFDLAVSLFFLAFLLAASLMLTTLTDVNEPKWFVIRTGAPALLAAAVLHDFFRDGRVRRPGPIGVLALVYLAWHALSWAGAVNPGQVWTRTSEVAGLVCTYFLAERVASGAKSRDGVCWTLLTIGGAVSAYGVAQHFGYDFFPWQKHREVPVSRGVSFYGHATFAASVLIQIIPLGLALFAARTGWIARALVSVPAGLMLYHLSFTGARMATLSFLLTTASAALWWFLRWRRKRPVEEKRTRSMRLIALSLAAVLLTGAVGGWFLIRAWQTKGSDAFAIRQSSMALRIYTWETASRMIFAHPLMGVGAGNYEIASPQYWNKVEQMRTARFGRWMQQAHNEYLQTAAELGLPGVALLLAIFAYAFVMALEVAARAPGREDRLLGLGMATAVGAIALDANITFSLQAPGSALVLWAMLGLIAASHERIGPRPGTGGLSKRPNRRNLDAPK